MTRGLPPPPVPRGGAGSSAAHFKDVPTARLVRELQRYWHEYRGTGPFIRRKNAYALIDFLLALHERADRSTFNAARTLILSSNRRERMQGFAILRELGDPRPKFPETMGLLEKAIRAEKDRIVHHWALNCLGWTNKKRAVPTLLRYVNYPHPWSRSSVANNIIGCAGTADDPRVVQALLTLSEDVDVDVRWDALYEVAEYVKQTPPVREMLRRRMKDRSARIREMAEKAYRRRRPQTNY